MVFLRYFPLRTYFIALFFIYYSLIHTLESSFQTGATIFLNLQESYRKSSYYLIGAPSKGMHCLCFLYKARALDKLTTELVFKRTFFFTSFLVFCCPFALLSLLCPDWVNSCWKTPLLHSPSSFKLVELFKILLENLVKVRHLSTEELLLQIFVSLFSPFDLLTYSLCVYFSSRVTTLIQDFFGSYKSESLKSQFG